MWARVCLNTAAMFCWAHRHSKQSQW